jgi:hypothetical protein
MFPEEVSGLGVFQILNEESRKVVLVIIVKKA